MCDAVLPTAAAAAGDFIRTCLMFMQSFYQPSFVCWSCARHLGGCSTDYIHPAVAKMLSNGWLFQLHSSSLLLPSENMLGRKDEERVIIITIFIHPAVRQAASALPGDFPRHIGNYGNSHRFLRHLDIWGWLPEILTASNLFQSLFVSCFSFTWQVPGMYLARFHQYLAENSWHGLACHLRNLMGPTGRLQVGYCWIHCHWSVQSLRKNTLTAFMIMGSPSG